jgi:hypothetical protein
LKNYVYLCIYILSMNRAAFILYTWWNLVLWKGQALAHYVGQGARRACRGKLGDTPNITGKARWLHDIKVWDGRFMILKNHV